MASGRSSTKMNPSIKVLLIWGYFMEEVEQHRQMVTYIKEIGKMVKLTVRVFLLTKKVTCTQVSGRVINIMEEDKSIGNTIQKSMLVIS